MQGGGTVSYTHLDVYKRQVVSSKVWLGFQAAGSCNASDFF